MNRRYTDGAVTLEAALVLPFFIFFMMNLLTLFDALRVDTLLYAALHQAGREIGARAFDVKFATDAAGVSAVAQSGVAQAGGNLLSAGYAGERIKDYLTECASHTGMVQGGIRNVSLLRSDFLSDGDIIDLVATLKIKPFISIAGFDAFPVEARYYAHAWTGYRVVEARTRQAEDEDETVYITPNGEVYHRSASCTYLRPTVHAASSASVLLMRNRGGAIYYPCEACGGGEGTVYVTPYGDRYHASSTCNKISHEILAVPLDEVSGRRACSKCGATH